MSKFDEMVFKYRTEVLEEGPSDPAVAAEPAGAPVADPAAPVDDPAASAPAQLETDPEADINNLIKMSKKPWIDLASTLARSMGQTWDEDKIVTLENKLPGGLTISDFVDVDNSPRIENKYDENIKAAAITFFDIVDKAMDTSNPGDEITPAEDR